MNTSSFSRRLLRQSVLPAICIFGLAACSSSGDEAPEEDDHPVEHIDSAGRLAITENDGVSLRVADLDDNRILDAFTLRAVPTAVHASPDYRYAVALQGGANNRVEVIDGGLYQWLHEDHFHDEKVPPKLLPFTIDMPRPAHYASRGDTVALWADGNPEQGSVAGIRLLTSEGIGKGEVLASTSFVANLHGAAEPMGNFVLASVGTEEAPSAPSQVAVYERSGAALVQREILPEACPQLHGNYAIENIAAFGCSYGVLLVKQDGSTFTPVPVANPDGRITTIVGHPDRLDFIGIGAGGVFRIDPATEPPTIEKIEWTADADRIRRAHTFDRHGEHFLILDDQGHTHVLEAAHGYRAHGSPIATVPAMPAAAPWPVFAVSQADDAIYVSDPVGRSVIALDVETGEAGKRLDLDFVPRAMVWIGLPEHDHGHDHAH